MATLVSLQRLLRNSLVACLLLQATHAGDAQWSREFMRPGQGSATPNAIIGINAMLLENSGKLLYAGTRLLGAPQPDVGFNTMVELEGFDRRALAWMLTSGAFHTVVRDGAKLYVGGEFRNIAGVALTNLVVWDGQTWSMVGGGVYAPPAANGSFNATGVRSLALKDGSLYVGGAFTTAGGQPASNIARWDGVAWDTMNGGITARTIATPAVNVIKFVGERLYVGGSFHKAGGLPATNVASFLSGQWQSLGEGAENGISGDNQIVQAFEADAQENLYVGGGFTRAGTVDASMVAKWTGGHWEKLGLQIGQPSSPGVNALRFHGGDLYAIGTFQTINGVDVPQASANFARWDGQNWHTVNAPVAYGGRALLSDGANLYAAAPLANGPMPYRDRPWAVLKWDGAIWRVIGDGMEPLAQPGALAVDGDRILVGGRMDLANFQHALAWSPAAGWEYYANQLQGLYGAIDMRIRDFEVHAGKIYAAGSFLGAGGTILNGVAVYSAQTWQPLGDGLPGGGLAVVARGDEVFAGYSAGIRRWDGQQWTELGAIGGAVQAIVLDGDFLYAAGTFSSGGLNNVARWNGSAWEPLGAGVNGPVRTMKKVGDLLYVGGAFVEAGGARAFNLATWNGQTWTEVGGGLSAGRSFTAVNALEPDGRGGLFVGGDFTIAGASSANSVAHWNGQSWTALGSGLNHEVTAMVLKGRDLFFVGQFSTAGGWDSMHMARWRIQTLILSATIGVDGELQLSAAGQGPARFRLQTSIDLSTWDDLSTYEMTGSSMDLAIEPQTGDARFFRLLELD